MPGERRHHTDKMHSCVAKVTAQGHSEDSAWAICTATMQKAGKPIFEGAESGSPAELVLLSLEAPSETRHLHLRGALGAVRTEKIDEQEYLVVPVVALMDGVIHAVNASNPERVTAETLAKAAASWNGRPLVLGHPMKNGRQCSANEPSIKSSHHFGMIFNSRMVGPKLLMDAYVDPVRAEKIGGPDFIKKLRNGEQIEVSVGAYVQTRPEEGTYNGRTYKATWLETHGDHLAFLPGSKGACSIEMGCGAHRAAQMHLVTAEGFKILGGPGSGRYPKGSGKQGSGSGSGSSGGSDDRGHTTTTWDEDGREIFHNKPQADELTRLVTSFVNEIPTEDVLAMQKDDDLLEKWETKFYDTVQKSGLDPSGAAPQGTSLLDFLPRIDLSKAKLTVEQQAAADEPESKVDLLKMHDTYIANWNALYGKKKKKLKGASSKDCSVCGGTGQVKNEKKQEDCPSCEGSGKITTAETNDGTAVEEVQMKKVDAIKALTSCPCSGFVVADAKELEAFSEERLTAMAEVAITRKKTEEDLEAEKAEAAKKLKAAEDAKKTVEEKLTAQIAELKAAAEKTPTEDEYLAKAPESIRTLVAEKKIQDAKAKTDLVAQLKVAAAGAYTEAELNEKPIQELMKLAQMVKIDYSGRSIPASRTVETSVYAPPDPYEKGIKILQGKSVN